MNVLDATKVHVDPIEGGYDHGEGQALFIWEDELMGCATLSIDCDGFFSREMPINSGSGPWDFSDLSTHGITLRFDSNLAERLKLPDTVRIQFNLSEQERDHLDDALSHYTHSPKKTA